MIRKLKKKIEALRFEAEEQTRKGQFDRVSKIQYDELPKLEKELKQLDAAQSGNAGVARMLKEEVDEEDIAGIVSKWTGIPVSRMLEGEVKKLVHMEERLRERTIIKTGETLTYKLPIPSDTLGTAYMPSRQGDFRFVYWGAAADFRVVLPIYEGMTRIDLPGDGVHKLHTYAFVWE